MSVPLSTTGQQNADMIGFHGEGEEKEGDEPLLLITTKTMIRQKHLM